jgi:hypothetical protein
MSRRVNHYTLPRFRAWVARQPQERLINFMSAERCPLTRYAREVDVPGKDWDVLIFQDHNPHALRLSEIISWVDTGKSTYADLLRRLRRLKR